MTEKHGAYRDAPASIEEAHRSISATKAVVKAVGSSRELSVVLTKLDEARMWLEEHVTIQRQAERAGADTPPR